MNLNTFFVLQMYLKKGAAALLMSNFRESKSIIKYNYMKISLEDLIKNLNEDVNNAAKGEKFITFFAAHYNGKTKTLQYINAGHNYSILVDHQKTKLLNKGCIGLGMLEEIEN